MREEEIQECTVYRQYVDSTVDSTYCLRLDQAWMDTWRQYRSGETPLGGRIRRRRAFLCGVLSTAGVLD